MKKSLLLVPFMAAFCTVASAQSRSHARSMTITQGGIVATSQTLASQAGSQVLARGGSAVDAAIAANAVLGVMEPMMCGIGGDLFVLYWDAKTKKLTGLNASGWSAKKLTPEFLQKKDLNAMPETGIHSATVPGAADGWRKMHQRFGKLAWAELFQPAIYYAEHGFPVTETIQAQWNEPKYQTSLGRDENARKLYLPNGQAPKVGELFKNPDLGHAYRLLATEGARSVYTGSIARALLKTEEKFGGPIEAGDLEEFSSEWVNPISTTYNGWNIYELPPNGQGIAALEMLNVMEGLGLKGLEPFGAEALHLKMESMKLAYADLSHVGDPRFQTIPVEPMLSKDYAKQRAALVDKDHAKCNVSAGDFGPRTGNTVYLSVVDREGNIASWIQSISSVWGSGIVVDGMGFMLHNRGANFELTPDRPNSLAPRRRPRHTIIPAFAEKDNVHIGFGIMGGSNQPMAHAQFVSNVVDFGLNIQAALEAPRFTKVYTGGCDVLIEGRVSPEVRHALEEKGHQLTVLGDYAAPMGRGQAVLRDDATKTNFGASSPRGDGAAIPEADPYFAPRRAAVRKTSTAAKP